MKSTYFVIKNGAVQNLIVLDKENSSYNPDGSGVVELTDELIEYTGFIPKIGDKFTTIGNIHTVPPGAFISSDKG